MSDPTALPPAAGEDMPLSRLSREAAERLVAQGVFPLAQLAALALSDGYAFAVQGSLGRPVGALPAPFVAVLHDREPGRPHGPLGHDLATVNALVGACDGIAFTTSADDTATLGAAIAAVRARRGSLVIVETLEEYLGAWMWALGLVRPGAPVLPLGAFAVPATLN